MAHLRVTPLSCFSFFVFGVHSFLFEKLFCLFICVFVYLFVRLFACSFDCSSVCSFAWLFAWFLCLFICVFFYVFYLFVFIWLFYLLLVVVGCWLLLGWLLVGWLLVGCLVVGLVVGWLLVGCGVCCGVCCGVSCSVVGVVVGRGEEGSCVAKTYHATIRRKKTTEHDWPRQWLEPGGCLAIDPHRWVLWADAALPQSTSYCISVNTVFAISQSGVRVVGPRNLPRTGVATFTSTLTEYPLRSQ